MQSLIFLVNMVFLIVVTLIRYSHAGRVCTGAFILDTLETHDMGHLAVEGQFLTVYTVAGWIQAGIMVTVIFISACIPTEKNSPDKERDL